MHIAAMQAAKKTMTAIFLFRARFFARSADVFLLLFSLFFYGFGGWRLLPACPYCKQPGVMRHDPV